MSTFFICRNFILRSILFRLQPLPTGIQINGLRSFSASSYRASQAYYIAKSPTKGESYRLHLEKSRHLVGIRTTRGIRQDNEDRYRVSVLDLGNTDIEKSFENTSLKDDTTFEKSPIHDEFELEGKSGQICYFGIFDGHGGSSCADYLTENLHNRIEEVRVSDADDIVTAWKKVGGYFRRFRPSSLAPLLKPESSNTPRYRTLKNSDNNANLSATRNFSSTAAPGTQTLSAVPTPHSSITLEQRLTMAFLKTDHELIGSPGGSTASVAIVKAMDRYPFWSTEELDITVAHVGDTRVILCDVPTGNAISLTFDHHPSDESEHHRLRKSGGFVITDSFGSDMFLGRLANTRALGDSKMKKYGVSAEPEIVNKRIKGNDAAFLVFVSDGVTSVLNDQEIVDCVKNQKDPAQSAAELVDLAEKLGSEDNITAMVVRLPGWGSSMPDHTEKLRKYRLDNVTPNIRRRT